MKELLNMCGFEERELTTEIDRISKAFDKFNITQADMDVAKDRLNKYFEIDLKGFRKLLKVYIKEMVNLALAREEKRKIIYNTLPALVPFLAASATIADGTVYSGLPDMLMFLTYGYIFKKIGKVHETAERDALPYEGAHCGCTKLRLGSRLLQLTPDPDLLIAWAVYCDEAPKLDEYIAAELGIPVHTVSRIQDVNFNEGEPERQLNHFASEIRRAKDRISEVIGIPITDEMMWQALMEGGITAQFNEKLLKLMLNSDPVPLSATTIWYIYVLYVAGVSRENMPALEEAMNLILEEATERVNRGQGYYEKGAPRIAIYMPSLLDPSLMYLIKEVGLSLPVFEGTWYCPDAALIPNLGTIQQLNDPCKVMAVTYNKVTILAPTTSRLSAMACAIERYNLDGFLGLNHYPCRPIMNDGFIFKDAWKKHTNVPVAQLECDLYDDRVYSSEAMRTRVESFAEMCKMAKSARSRIAA